jgi:hypothetical protein
MYSTRLNVYLVLTCIRTFLKRKGGLFKKAHELSVLCSVDVAVIIFGHNKKLYEFSSGDINETIGRYQYVRYIQSCAMVKRIGQRARGSNQPCNA